MLIAELQRIASHLVWLGTHGMEVGAVSVMLYCFREREQLMNINEMLAGFRMFPSYFRIGGLREDLPRGFHEAVKEFLDKFPGKIDDYDKLLTKNQIWVKRTKGVGRLSREDTIALGIVGPMARAVGVPYDVRRAFPYLHYETFDFDVPTQTDGDVYARYLVKLEEMRQSVRICRQALERISPTGVYDCGDYRIVPPPKDRVYTEMEALIQHFLLYSQGFNVPKGEAYVPVEGPARRTRLLHRVGRHEPADARQVARAVVPRLSGAAEDDRGRPDRGRDRRDRVDGRRHGRRRPVRTHRSRGRS